ncbi:MAG: hypothetical protein GTO26_09465 [Planctomycetales bacterium]|nr:hypothetical protein [Planctomycetales bacterium]
MRLANLSNVHHSVSVEACHACHADFFAPPQKRTVPQPEYLTAVAAPGAQTDRPAQDHNFRVAAEDAHLVQHCVLCHKEHLGEQQLSWVADAHCIGCHGNLRVQDGKPTFAHNISSFADHPEFAIRRDSPPEQSHSVHLVAEPVAEGGWSDRAKIRFNHQYHLDPEGVPVPPGHPDYGDGKTLKKLSCGDCHQPDAAGLYMQPINFEQHCAACHQLTFSTQLSLVGDSQTLPLPHEKPELIRGVLRDHLMAYATAHPEKIVESGAPQADQRLPRHPNHLPHQVLRARDKWEWVEKKLVAMEQAVRCGTRMEGEPEGDCQTVVISPQDKIISHVESGCAQCHYVQPATAGGGADDQGIPLWQIVEPRIPNRWMQHSRFDHGRHTEISCRVCHNTLAAKDVASEWGDPSTAIPLNSQRASDILMPSVRVCQSCHGDSAASLGEAGRHGRARDNCVECHLFHHPLRGHPAGDLSSLNLFGSDNEK